MTREELRPGGAGAARLNGPMRVDDRTLTASLASEAAAAQETQKSVGTVATGGAGGRCLHDQDRVVLSSLSGALHQAVLVDATRRAQRIEQLAQQYEAGRYVTDPVRLGRALVAESTMCLNGPAAEKR